jgi:hypothetical protein
VTFGLVGSFASVHASLAIAAASFVTIGSILLSQLRLAETASA